MKNITYEITEKDIKDYLDKHSKDELIKFKEALFVKYMKNTDILSGEKIGILLEKDNNMDNTDIIVPIYNLYNFTKYLFLQQLDTSAYLHILIPILKLNSEKLKSVNLYERNIEKYLPSTVNDYSIGLFNDTLEDYEIAGLVNKKQHLLTVDDILLDKNDCLYELVEYTRIYGLEPIERVKRLVKEND